LQPTFNFTIILSTFLTINCVIYHSLRHKIVFNERIFVQKISTTHLKNKIQTIIPKGNIIYTFTHYNLAHAIFV
jgi:hypothetical protein